MILSREFLVSGLREFLASAAVSLPVSCFAKFKTTIQMFAIGAMILGPIADRIVPGALDIAYVALWAAAGLTVWTGWVYFRAGLAHLQASPGRDDVTLLYFAWVRQKVGQSEETFALPAALQPSRELAAWLAVRGGRLCGGVRRSRSACARRSIRIMSASTRTSRPTTRSLFFRR